MVYARLSFQLAAMVLLAGCLQADRRNEHSLKGVWEYVEDDVLQEVKGMSFFGEHHFAFVVNFNHDSAGQKILAYSGTYTMRDSIVTATIHYAHNPALIGQNLRWVHGVEGQIASYQVLDRSGKVVESGKVRRLE